MIKKFLQALGLLQRKQRDLEENISPIAAASTTQESSSSFYPSVSGVPDEFELFAFGSSQSGCQITYRHRDQSDWASTDDINILCHTRTPCLTEINNDEYLLPNELLDISSANETITQLQDVVAGRIRVFSPPDSFSASDIHRDLMDDRKVFWFEIETNQNFIFGSTKIIHYFTISELAEPAFVHVQVRVRRRGSFDADWSKFAKEISVKLSPLNEFTDGKRKAASEAMRLMHDQGIPSELLNTDTVAQLTKDLQQTLPELHSVGHIFARNNIVAWTALNDDNIGNEENLARWCQEAARSALAFPDNHFRSFLSASIQSRLLISAKDANWGATSPAFQAFHRFLRFVELVPDTLPVERYMLLLWFLVVHQNISDAELINVAMRKITDILPSSELTGDLLIQASMAIDAIQGPESGSQLERSLLGIHRTELAIGLLHQAARSTEVGVGLLTHQALFSPLHQLNMKYQADFYGMREDEVNTYLQLANSGLPPGIVLLRPLTSRRSIYVRNDFDPERLPGPMIAGGRLQFLSLEGAIAHAVRPTGMETNAVGGLTDIVGMQRSGAAGFGGMDEAGWMLMVKGLLDLSAVILILPDCSEGVEWEIAEITRRDIFNKCIFIQLPHDMDWHDNGNWAAFEKNFGLQRERLNKTGQFVFGKPNDPDAVHLEWDAMWNGELTKTIEKVFLGVN